MEANDNKSKRSKHVIIDREDYEQLCKYRRYITHWCNSPMPCKTCGELNPQGYVCISCGDTSPTSYH